MKKRTYPKMISGTGVAVINSHSPIDFLKMVFKHELIDARVMGGELYLTIKVINKKQYAKRNITRSKVK